MDENKLPCVSSLSKLFLSCWCRYSRNHWGFKHRPCSRWLIDFIVSTSRSSFCVCIISDNSSSEIVLCTFASKNFVLIRTCTFRLVFHMFRGYFCCHRKRLSEGRCLFSGSRQIIALRASQRIVWRSFSDATIRAGREDAFPYFSSMRIAFSFLLILGSNSEMWDSLRVSLWNAYWYFDLFWVADCQHYRRRNIIVHDNGVSSVMHYDISFFQFCAFRRRQLNVFVDVRTPDFAWKLDV